MTNGILLALLAYATYSWSDAAIKALGGELSIFEIGFFQTAIAGASSCWRDPAGNLGAISGACAIPGRCRRVR